MNNEELQVAMTEYRDMSVGKIAYKPNGEVLGYVSMLTDNKNGNGEQIEEGKSNGFIFRKIYNN